MPRQLWAAIDGYVALDKVEPWGGVEQRILALIGHDDLSRSIST